ncbi:MAG: transcription-repair coupling factor [Ancrocorticia sp.]|jgi:transcription-repair coupling factor (superfamily II helicase)|nr:transcription-repair coupling factor [Ancrocorticia sp.]MCI1933078.1 transcription-repair coupling factor [Ancrocorticia sp.]MCI2178081.1 transcription-repair coupling factor [Ancrocorticia sp.]MCI2199409.1 transcription-repair coupling factor [Ancrocorticia sp.]
MDLRPLLGLIAHDGALREAASDGGERRDIALPRGVIPPALAMFATGTDLQWNRSAAPGAPHVALHVVVTATGADAERLAGALRAYLPPENVDTFPAWETLPHERLSPRSDTVAQRLLVLRRLAHPEEFAPLRIVIVPVRALMQPIVDGLGELKPVRLRQGDRIDLAELEKQLSAAAYTRVDMVERRGEFAVRGGIVDIFPPTDSHPSRVEFFGDEVDEIRTFSIGDQRSLETVSGVYAPPCREILITDAVKERAKALIPALPGAVDMLDSIAHGIPVEGMESLAPVLVPAMVPLTNVFPAGTRLYIAEPERVAQRAESLIATTEEFLAAAWTSAAAGGSVPIDVNKASFTSLAQTRAQARVRGLAWWTLGGFAKDADATDYADEVHAREPKKFLGKIDEAIAAIGQHAQQGWREVLVVEGAGLGRRLTEQLTDADVPARYVADLPGSLEPAVCYVTAAPIDSGFVMEPEHLAVFAAADILGRGGSSTRDMRKLPARRKATVDPLQLKPGDFIVHERHGVGRFVKMAKRAIGANKETQREYVVVEYASTRRGAPPDQLWIPTDSLDQVSKYSGGDKPALNKMGGADWDKTKAKARAATKQIAAELVRLYAQRQATSGYAFSPDTPWQRELEDAFEYVETPDQLHTIEEVKADMEKPVPMDRLISGDVGYGKTEIAVRAAFKAAQDSKQVAILVPTTLLVQQHFETFSERYSGFPIRLAALSRFQSDKEAAQTIKGLAGGTIDVVIGTHRLLTGDVRFKDLGLVIIDEEQRFGVEHKETLKQMYPTVDVLSMSATPIPRTLEMAVTGVREMSTLATPPEERHPVLTYVGAQEDKQIIAAIRRELLRDGQVFYVHNRVGDMDSVAAHLSDLVPEARIAIAHGKMNEHQLERVILDFWEKNIDVLVCTTIVETGLDISNANTLIVEDADKFGLSQLHQLRGRVGRGRERAYAYFLYRRDRALTETALERLRTIAANTDLGAGIQVAMKDLEIRGAGNMLGGEQSGHIAGVGFDLYVRMVSEAVAKLRGGEPDDDGAAADVRIELPVDAYLPETYVPSERLRLEVYTKIAACASKDDRDSVHAELVDRYGPVPKEAERLFRIAELRDVCRKAGIEEVTLAGRNVRFAPVQLPDSRQARLKRLYPGALAKPAVRTILVPLPGTKGRIGQVRVPENEQLIEWVEQLIRAVFLARIGA